MSNWLWLIPALPLAGFALLALAGRRLTPRGVAVIGVGSVGLAALVALLACADLVAAPPPGDAWIQELWRWIDVAGFAPAIGLRLDPLAAVMVAVVTGVGFLIHLYSAESMAGEEGYARYFAYLNLFVAAMSILVLADNLLFLYLGWEGVGLCSYLLIGFWYRDPANGLAARKAFIVTRTGDVAFTLGVLLLFTRLGSLDIQTLMQEAARQWPAGSALATAAAALLLFGALGKSAQLPLQTWLPDAMAGPTPVSALIHAATMVTAGVYLIARLHVLYALAPAVQAAVAVIGAATLLLAGTCALAQRDIKRVLAYSTISQIGYMFLALGVGAWSAAIFHFMTHAFFKALLFLSAGAVIQAFEDEHDIFRMGGLRRRLPLAFWSFVIGAASLAALPLVTAGFYSKDLILWQAWASPLGSRWLWTAGWVGAILTGAYIFRVVFVAFLGESTRRIVRRPGWRMGLPLVVLSALSVVGGLVEMPPMLGNRPLLSNFLRPVLPPVGALPGAAGFETALSLLAFIATVAGVYAAYRGYVRRAGWFVRIVGSHAGTIVNGFLLGGGGFDALYEKLLVRPFVQLAHWDRRDFVDAAYAGLARLCRVLYRLLSVTQNGRVRRYAAGIVVGAVAAVAIALLELP
ncbi:MAG: NADH-quinone oxidoreductase subunit L [Rhodocyclaceae bacterium]|nr:NADH-quinone oxidoreductase subunit L [Rhodocyclaceae bacterium]